MDARRLLTIVAAALLSLTCRSANAGFTIKVEPGEFAIERALQEARLRRLHEGGDHVVIKLKLSISVCIIFSIEIIYQ